MKRRDYVLWRLQSEAQLNGEFTPEEKAMMMAAASAPGSVATRRALGGLVRRAQVGRLGHENPYLTAARAHKGRR